MRSVTLAASTGEPSDRSVRWIMKRLGLPGVSGSCSKKFSIRSVNSVRDSVSGCCSLRDGCGPRHPNTSATMIPISTAHRRSAVVVRVMSSRCTGSSRAEVLLERLEQLLEGRVDPERCPQRQRDADADEGGKDKG